MTHTPADIEPASAETDVAPSHAPALPLAGDADLPSAANESAPEQSPPRSADILPFPSPGEARQGRLRGEETLHRRLAAFNAMRWQAALPGTGWSAQLQDDLNRQLQEGRFIESERRELRRGLLQVPQEVSGLLDWLEGLPRQAGHDALLAALAGQADLEQMRWFLRQELATELYQDEVLALVALRLPLPARLTLARAQWQDLGEGDARETRAAQWQRLMRVLRLEPAGDEAVWEALALRNGMVALAANRRYAYQALGALLAHSLLLPERCPSIDEGLRRLGISAPARLCLDRGVQQARQRYAAWRQELLGPLLASDGRIARAVAEGALLYLRWRQRCDSRYRRELALPTLN